MATALDLATVDVNTGLAALQTADSTFQELRKGNLDTLIEIRDGRWPASATKRPWPCYRRATLLAALVFLLAILGAGWRRRS